MSSKTNKLFLLALAHLRAILESLGHMLARPGTVLWSLLGIQLQAHAGPSKTNKLFWREPIWGAILACLGPILACPGPVLGLSGIQLQPHVGPSKNKMLALAHLGGHLGLFWAYFGLSWSCLGLSWGYLGAFLGSSFSPMSGQAKKHVYFCVGPVRGPSWPV